MNQPQRTTMAIWGAAAAVLVALARLYISEPARSGSSRAAPLFLARPWVLPSGQHTMAVVEVPTGLLGSIVAQAMELSGLAITLERDDGRLMLSVPAGRPGLSRHLAGLTAYRPWSQRVP